MSGGVVGSYPSVFDEYVRGWCVFLALLAPYYSHEYGGLNFVSELGKKTTKLRTSWIPKQGVN